MAPGTKATASLTAAAERYTRLIFLHGRGTPTPDEHEQGHNSQPTLNGCTVSVTNETEVRHCYVAHTNRTHLVWLCMSASPGPRVQHGRVLQPLH